VLLGVFAVMMAGESVERLFRPVAIDFDHALIVAVMGLAVNAVTLWILGGHHEAGEAAHGHAHHHDHNLRSAFLHVLADALTSVLAIGALAAGKFYGTGWLDPVIGLLGAALVAQWSWGLVHQAGEVLLDRQAPSEVREAIRVAIESDCEDRLVDLHVWSIAPGRYAAIIVVITSDPRPPDEYKALLPPVVDLAHVNVEVHPCVHDAGPAVSSV